MLPNNNLAQIQQVSKFPILKILNKEILFELL